MNDTLATKTNALNKAILLRDEALNEGDINFACILDDEIFQLESEIDELCE